jgi:hypothetical protein
VNDNVQKIRGRKQILGKESSIMVAEGQGMQRDFN